ncbi:MAG: GIY-YIG nuclease family protein, partial [Balneolaceae bacterium]
MFYTYILRSEQFEKHYYGHTEDLEKRLNDHNRGKVRSTKAYRPWFLIYHESFKTKSEAYNREL